MTWKEFKEAVEAQEVKDEDELWYIDAHKLGRPDPGIEVGATDDGWAIWS